MTYFGMTEDYEYDATHKRHRIRVWEGPFMSNLVADGFELPRGDGYMLTTYNGDKVRVTCPVIRTDENYEQQDAAIHHALSAHFDGIRSHDPEWIPGCGVADCQDCWIVCNVCKRDRSN